MCYDRLEDMLKLVSSTVVKKESKFVVQKYIGKHDITTVPNNKMSFVIFSVFKQRLA